MPLRQSSSNKRLSLPGGLKELKEKLQQSLQRLEDDGEEYPEFELFRKKLIWFYTKTTSPKKLADHLLQNKVLSRYQRTKIEQEKGNYNKNARLYDYVHKKGGLFHFVDALKITENEHVLKIIEDLVLQNETKYETRNECSQSISNKQGRDTCGLESRIEFHIRESISSFKGREGFIDELHLELGPRNPTSTNRVLSKLIVITGLPGIGKTQTVQKYIEKYKASYGHIIWINADGVHEATKSFLQLAAKLNIDLKEKVFQLPAKANVGTKCNDKPTEVNQLIQDIYDRLTKKNILVIYDDAHDYENCKDLLPGNCMYGSQVPAIIVTSRNNAWNDLKVKPLPEFTVEECFCLLETKLDFSIRAKKDQVKEIMNVCGGLPILIQQIITFIKYVNSVRKTFSQAEYTMQAFLEDLEHQNSELLTAVVERDLNCYLIFKTAFDRLRAQPILGRLALKCLDIMSLLNPDNIPKVLLVHLLEKCHDYDGRINSEPPLSKRYLHSDLKCRISEVLKLLLHAYMITEGTGFYQINRIVQTMKLEEHSRKNTKVDFQQDMINLVNCYNDYVNNTKVDEPDVNKILVNGWQLYKNAKKELGKDKCTHFYATLVAKEKFHDE